MFMEKNDKSNYSSVIPTFIKIAKQNKSMKINNGVIKLEILFMLTM